MINRYGYTHRQAERLTRRGIPTSTRNVLMGMGSIFVVVVGLLLVNMFRAQQEEPEELPTLAVLAPMLDIGAPVLAILQRAGPPTCKVPTDAGERWLYAGARSVDDSCTPGDGDLVLFVRSDRIASFVPEYGKWPEVASPSDMAEFRRRYTVRR